MQELVETKLYDQYGIKVPQEMFGNKDLLSRLDNEVKHRVPNLLFKNQFSKTNGRVERGGFPWEVRVSATDKGYELIPPPEHYVVNFINKAGVMVPEYALLNGGRVAAEFQWDEFRSSPWLRLFDISCAGTLPNKTRFRRDENNPEYFHPTQFGVNLGLSQEYEPPEKRSSLPFPRLVYKFQTSALQIQWGSLPGDNQSGTFTVGTGGEQILIKERPTFQTISSIHLNIDETGFEYLVNAIPLDMTMGIHLSIPLAQEDPDYPLNIDLPSVDNWINRIGSIVIPQFSKE
ncbi:hypothetical protein KC675_02995 [Candidatus Dojkabacteria bacterium]|uniref:Uncharacterized protein n=1 Tax=Candidatus Dojkabacteria bacterium TaxID=2099670 RepID=A0A955I6T9_9BACT|nr:hypothetical protein [Candidatus Dojkabacteria bacterium]